MSSGIVPIASVSAEVVYVEVVSAEVVSPEVVAVDVVEVGACGRGSDCSISCDT